MVEVQAAIAAAQAQALGLVTDNIALILAIPIAFVGLKVAKRVIAKF